MTLFNFLRPLVDRSTCEVRLFCGNTLDSGFYIASSSDYKGGVIELYEHFGDYSVLEYNIGNHTLNVLIDFDILDLYEMSDSIEIVPSIVIEVVGLL